MTATLEGAPSNWTGGLRRASCPTASEKKRVKKLVDDIRVVSTAALQIGENGSEPEGAMVNKLALRYVNDMAGALRQILLQEIEPNSPEVRRLSRVASDLNVLSKFYGEASNEELPYPERRGRRRLSCCLARMSTKEGDHEVRDLIDELDKTAIQHRSPRSRPPGNQMDRLRHADPTLSDAQLTSLLEGMNKIRELSLPGCQKITGQQLPEKTLKRLRSMDLSDTSLSSEGLTLINQHADSLCELTIYGCSDIASCKALDELRERCIVLGPGKDDSNVEEQREKLAPFLECIAERIKRNGYYQKINHLAAAIENDMAQTTLQDDEPWSKVWTNTNALLKQANSEKVPVDDKLFDACLQLSEAVKKANSERVLNAAKGIRLEVSFDKWLDKKISQYFAALYVAKKLEIIGLRELTDDLLALLLDSLCTHCPELDVLVIGECPKITGKSFGALRSYILKELDLQNCSGLTVEGIKTFGELPVGTIEIVKVGTVSKKIAKAITRLPSQAPRIAGRVVKKRRIRSSKSHPLQKTTTTTKRPRRTRRKSKSKGKNVQ